MSTFSHRTEDGSFLITVPGGPESIALLPCYESGKQDVTEVLGEVLELFGGCSTSLNIIYIKPSLVHVKCLSLLIS